VFAAEAGTDDVTYHLDFQRGYQGNPNQVTYAHAYPNNYYYYLSAAWRANHWLELGAYYSQYHFDQRLVGTPTTTPGLDQSDYALSARFDITDYLIFKLEGHYMYGSGEVFDLPSYRQPTTQRNNQWMMVTAKITLYF